MKKNSFEKIHKLLKSGKRDEALSFLLNLKTGRIRHPYGKDLNHAWYLVGDIYYKRNDYNKSLGAFKKSYKYWRDDAEAVWAIGNCYYEMGKLKQAIIFYKKAIVKGGPADALNLNLGNSYYDLQKYDLAKQHFSLAKTR